MEVKTRRNYNLSEFYNRIGKKMSTSQNKSHIRPKEIDDDHHGRECIEQMREDKIHLLGITIADHTKYYNSYDDS